PQIPAKQISEQRAHEVDRQKIPMQVSLADPSMPKRQGKEQPIQWVRRSRLRLTKQRLTCPVFRIPERKVALMPLARLELIPWQNLKSQVGSLQPGDLLGENQLPTENH